VDCINKLRVHLLIVWIISPPLLFSQSVLRDSNLVEIYKNTYIKYSDIRDKGTNKFNIDDLDIIGKKFIVISEKIKLPSGKGVDILGRRPHVLTKSKFDLYIIDQDKLNIDTLMKFKSSQQLLAKYYSAKEFYLTDTPYYGFEFDGKKSVLNRLFFNGQRNSGFVIYNEKFILIGMFKKYKGKKAKPFGFFTNIIPIYINEDGIYKELHFIRE